MKEFFAAYPALAWSMVSVMLALVVVATLWEKIRWWWHNTWYSFPLVGRLATLSRDGNMDTSHPGWSKAERTLCRDYKKFIRIQDEHDFNEKITYLTKAGDIGRSETPGWIWLLTMAMVFVEAMGFSYVLAGYTLPGASENLQQTGAYGIAFLISVILVAFTHFAGHELFKSNQIKNARREWVEDNRSHKMTTGIVPLAKPQSVDDDMPTYTQLANRVGTHPSQVILIATVVFVLIIAAFATYVRGQVLEKQLQQQVTGQLSQADLPKTGGDGLNMAASGSSALPDADLQANKTADVKAINDEANIDRHGGWGTFIVLAFVFVFLQILGVIFGYRWGFAGKNSSEAFRSIGKGRYATYTDVREHYLEIAGVAQSKLEALQQKIMDRNSRNGTDGRHLNKNFLDFIQETREEEAKDRADERRHTEAKAARSAATVKAAAPAASAPAAQPALEPAMPSNVQQVIDQLERMQDKEEKKAYLATLPDTLNQAVRAALKARKDEAERKKKESDAELEELL